MNKKNLSFGLIIFNVFFFLYYSFQLIVFTDEFATKNIGFFNHAVAGLSEIIGIIFFSLAIGLIIIIFRGSKNQLPLLITVLLIQTIISLNFWRYVFTNSPGEVDINTITKNALIFTIAALSMAFFLLSSKK